MGFFIFHPRLGSHEVAVYHILMRGLGSPIYQTEIGLLQFLMGLSLRFVLSTSLCLLSCALRACLKGLASFGLGRGLGRLRGVPG